MSEKINLSDISDVMTEVIHSGGDVKFRSNGTSMMPLLGDGAQEVLLTRAPERLRLYDIALYRRENGQFVLHRVVRVKRESYTFCGDNQWRHEKGIRPEQIIAVMKGFYKGETLISLKGMKYRIYCHTLPLREVHHWLTEKRRNFYARWKKRKKA